MFFDEMEKFGKNILMTDGKKHVFTYADAADYARQLGMQAEKRSVVLCLCENTVGSIAGYLGFLHNRVIPLLLDEKTDISFLQQII